MVGILQIHTGAIFAPPRTVEDLLVFDPHMIPTQVRSAVLSRQGGKVRASDQLEDLVQDVYLHLEKPAASTGKTPLQNFTLTRMTKTPENGWRAHISTVVTNHVINILRQPGPLRLQFAYAIQSNPEPAPYSIQDKDLPDCGESPEDTFLGNERVELGLQRVQRFRNFVAQHLGCETTLRGLDAFTRDYSRDEMVEELSLGVGEFRQLRDNLRSLWQVFIKEEIEARGGVKVSSSPKDLDTD
jgi:hypothetical protein